MDIKLERVNDHECKKKPEPTALGFGKYFTDHLFVMKYQGGKGWQDATIKKYENFSMDPASIVLHYGQAIFEGLKAYRRKDDKIFLFRPRANLERMNMSAARMCMPAIPTDEVLEALIMLLRLEKDWIPAAVGASLYIRPFMIATEAGLGVRPASEYIFCIILSPVGAYYAEGFSPVSIYVTDQYVRAAVGGVGDVKTSGNYAASIMAAVEAKKMGFTQVLWLDAVERRYIEEVGTMNIFFLIDDELITPPLSGSILPGITRDSVLQMTRDWGLKVSERPITIDEIFTANSNGLLKEAFGTGTAAVISPVGSLYYQGKTCTINNGRTGELANRLYNELLTIQYGLKEDPYGWLMPL